MQPYSLNRDVSLIDSHCHLDSVDSLADKLNQANAHGIEKFIVPGITPVQWRNIIDLPLEGVCYALGTHPWYVQNPEQDARLLSEAVERYSPVAIGEIGLDFYKGKTDRPARDIQLESFSRQLDVARHYNIPVILHCVKAHNEMLEILKKFPGVTGVVHAFSGSIQIAEQYIALGFRLGMGPLILKSEKLLTVFSQLPLNSLLLETDAPFMAIQPELNNNPLLSLMAVAEKLAVKKSMSLEHVAVATKENAIRLFNL